MTNKTLNLTRAAVIAALYVVLTMIANAAGLASGAIQIRISEALTILPVFTWAAVPGLTIGCLLANLLTGAAVWDIVFGAFATFLGALGTYWIGRKTHGWDRFSRSQVIPSSCPSCCNTHTEWKTDTSIWQRPLALEKLSAAV